MNIITDPYESDIREDEIDTSVNMKSKFNPDEKINKNSLTPGTDSDEESDEAFFAKFP